MKRYEKTIRARINPHIVGWYLAKELSQLQDLKQREEEQLSQLFSQLPHPLLATTPEEICFFTGRKKQIMQPLKNQLKAYAEAFDDDEPLSFDTVFNYLTEQLAALIAKETIERAVVDLAYDAHEQAEKNGLIEADTMGKAIFKRVFDGTVQKKVHFSPEVTREQPATTSDKPAVSSTLNVEAASFVPLALRKTITDSIELVGQTMFTSKAIRLSLCEDLIDPPSILGEPWEKVTSLETQRCVDEPFEKSKLYRFWLRPRTLMSSTTIAAPLEVGLGYDK